MANQNIQIYLTGFAFLSTLFGIILNMILSRRNSTELNKRIEKCNKVVIDQFDKKIYDIISHFSSETNRILEISIRKISAIFDGERKINEITEDDNNYDIIDIKNLEVKKLEIDFLDSYMKTTKANRYNRKLEAAYTRIKAFSWLFGFLLSVILILGVIIVILPERIPLWVLVLLLVFSVLSFITFIFNIIKTNDLINKTEKEYGVSI